MFVYVFSLDFNSNFCALRQHMWTSFTQLFIYSSHSFIQIVIMSRRTEKEKKTGIRTRKRIEIEIGTADTVHDLETVGNAPGPAVHVISDHGLGAVTDIANALDHHPEIRSHPSPAGARPLYIGMCHHQALSTFHLFNIRQCKVGLGTFSRYTVTI
jgi:hypothetical protein